ncbi:MAG TPA: PilZ domain-containing protein [Terriglobales bacterium]
MEALLVRIWGMGADGKAFFQNAHARSYSAHAAELTGIDHELNAGDVIGVQNGEKKARFRVIQTIDAGLPLKIKAQVELVDGQECPWKEQLANAPAKPAPGPTPNPKSNMRRFVRHRIHLPMELRDDRGGGVPMLTNASDVGGRGCYVETLTPLPLGTPLHITFWMEQEKMTTSAIVRASDPGVGMGIEFSGLKLEQQQKVQEYLDRIDPVGSGFASALVTS